MFIGGVHTQKQWRTDGGFEGSRRTEIPKDLQNRAQFNPNVKMIIFAEFRSPKSNFSENRQ
jgi:hypothetical protein